MSKDGTLAFFEVVGIAWGKSSSSVNNKHVASTALVSTVLEPHKHCPDY